MADTPPPPTTPDELFQFILRVSSGDAVMPSPGDICRALYQGLYAMEDRNRIRATSRGRSEPPTDEEITAHRKQRGSWLIAWDEPRVVSRPSELRKLAARCRRYGTPMRWIPINIGGMAESWPKGGAGP